MCEERGFKVRRKASTPSKISLKREKRSDLMASKQANEIYNNKKNKADSTENNKGRARSIFLCVVEEEGYKEVKESTNKRGKKWREIISTLETAKKRSEHQE